MEKYVVINVGRGLERLLTSFEDYIRVATRGHLARTPRFWWRFCLFLL